MIQFDKDQLFNNVYLKYPIQEDQHIDSMAVNMLINNSLEGVITVNQRTQDNVAWLYFNVTDFVRISEHPEVLANDRHMLTFLKGLCRIFSDCDSYLLDRTHILLEHAYADPASGEAHLLYMPIDEIRSETDLNSFLQEVLSLVRPLYSGERRVLTAVTSLLNSGSLTMPALESTLTGLQTEGAVSLDRNRLEIETPGRVPAAEKVQMAGLASAPNAVTGTSGNTASVRNPVSARTGAFDNPFATSAEDTGKKSSGGLFGHKRTSTVENSNTHALNPKLQKRLQKEQAKLEKAQQKERLKKEKEKARERARREKLVKKGKFSQSAAVDNPFNQLQDSNGSRHLAEQQSVPSVQSPKQEHADMMAPEGMTEVPSQPKIESSDGGYTVDLEQYLRQQEQAYQSRYQQAPVSPTGRPQQMFEGDGSDKTSLMEEMNIGNRTVLMGDEEVSSKPEYVLLLERTGEKYYINSANFHIGRGQGIVDLCIDSPTGYLSSDHAYITLEGGKIYLTDNASTNHTWLNGVKLTPNVRYELHLNDKMKLADEIFTLLKI